jgi:cytochrome c peroxidase
MALQALQERRNNGLPAIQDIYLEENEINDLIEFLRALTDFCVQSRDCIAPWIPGPDLPDPDNLRLHAIDKDGNPL